MLDKNLENKECRYLCGLFYSVFDDSLGRINVAQYPDFFSKELFDQVSNVVITKEDLANRVIVSKVDDKFVIGYLQSLENRKYPRNKFLFNVCFVVNDQVSNNLISYENLVRNVNRFFHSLEHETGRLVCADKDIITKFLENVYCSIKNTGMCKCTWDGFGTIYLRMGVAMEPDVVVEREQVPVLNINSNRRLIPLDLTCQRLLPLLDGERQVWEIAQRSAVDLKVVKACVQNLGYVGVVKTVVPFRLEAIYMCMPKLRRIWHDIQFRTQIVEHTLMGDISLLDKDKIELLAETALRALAVLGPKSRVLECQQILGSTNPGINCRQLIQFAEIEGLIRRIHGHPIEISEETNSRNYNIPIQLLDGTHNLEEICCVLGVEFSQLEQDLSNTDDIFMIWN